MAYHNKEPFHVRLQQAALAGLTVSAVLCIWYGARLTGLCVLFGVIVLWMELL